MYASAIVHYWERYLEEQRVLGQPPSLGPAELLLADYERHLSRVRGFAANTIMFHLRTVSEFLFRFKGDGLREGLLRLTAKDIEVFIKYAGRRLSRPTLQHTVAHLRSLLRFLTARGEVPSGLDTQIDTPRVYRGEKLPRALPWPTVCAFLQSIDRSASLGKRDYAIFQLMANYGLRSSEVVALKLDDIEWRVGRLQVRQRKTSSPLVLPLTDSVGESLTDYLRGGRPDADYREVFLRHRAPAGLLKPTAVTEAFQAWSRRSGLPIPYQGAHCLRHSYAVHLLRQGASLKTIGDILGHRSAESTCVYLRLAVEDLRDVALNLPSDEAGGVAS
jgi:site-specific recombinase XerD